MKNFSHSLQWLYELPFLSSTSSLDRIARSTIFLLSMFLAIGQDVVYSQCGFVSDPNSPPLPQIGCSPDQEWKCIRIKFHYLNNSTEPDKFPGNDYFYKILNRINEKFAPAKIRFTMDNNCVHFGTRDSIPDDLTSSSKLDSYMGFNGTSNPLNPKSFMEVDTNSLNFYMGQRSINSLPYANQYYAYDNGGLNSISSLVHELGHSMSLIHTFSDKAYQDPSTLRTYWDEPKSLDTVNSQGTPIAAFTGDLMMDTGLDPFDETYVNGCTKVPGCRIYSSYPASCKDKYNDATTDWNIPFSNYMSYYYSCHSEFSNCQIAAMHYNLLNRYQNIYSKYLMNCDDDTISTIPCSHIVISTDTTWTNQTIRMCPDQKIIITPTGRLTINNCVVTKKNSPPPNPNCPDLTDNGTWDGIYIENGHFNTGGNLIGGVPQAPNLNKLVINNGSVIEFSDYGINGNGEFGSIIISGSTIQHNGRIARVI